MIKIKVNKDEIRAKAMSTISPVGNDTSHTTVNADVLLNPYTAIDADGNLVTGNIETNSKYDVQVVTWDIAAGQLIVVVDVSSGYYPEDVSNTYMFTISDRIKDYIALPRGTKDTDTVQFRKIDGKWVGEIL